MKQALLELRESYTASLRAYLDSAGEEALMRAYELGRKVLAEDRGVLKLATVHHGALATVLQDMEESAKTVTIETAEGFFAESLLPFEMARGGYHEAITVLQHFNEMLEEQAKRTAHTLHDEAGQLLAAVRIALAEVSAKLPEDARNHLREVTRLLDQMEKQLRRLSHELRPTVLDDWGLLPAIEFLAEGFSKRTGVSVSVKGVIDVRLPPVYETALYRIVQEALTNVSKHAKATQVKVKLQRGPRRIRCSFQDNGVGFDVSAVLSKRGNRGLGILGIQERLNALGGTLEVISAPGKGTKLMLVIPLEVQDASSSPLS